MSLGPTPLEADVCTPVPAATVLLLRESPKLEVLMVKRGATRNFASALVFPGGKVSREDWDRGWSHRVSGADGLTPVERALRIAGWREVFEETGLLPFLPPSIPRQDTFQALVRQAERALPLDKMVPFARWITPLSGKERFDTHFYLGTIEAGEAICDGSETVAAEWMTPSDALMKEALGQHKIVFPTRCNLRRLAESQTIAEAYRAAAAVPPIAILPTKQERDGVTYNVIPQNAGYAVCEEPIVV